MFQHMFRMKKRNIFLSHWGLALVALGLWSFLALRLHGLTDKTRAAPVPPAPPRRPVLRPKDDSALGESLAATETEVIGWWVLL